MESDIAHASPVTREVFDHLLIKSNFADSKKFKRGQWFGTFDHIAEGLHWYEGFRKTKYTNKQIRSAIDFLKDKEMIRTRKSFRGLVITISKYNDYQDPSNYTSTGNAMGNAMAVTMEGTPEGTTEGTTEGTHLSTVKELTEVTAEGVLEVTPEVLTAVTIGAHSGHTTLEEDNKNTLKKVKINKADIIELMKKLDNIFYNHHVQLGVYKGAVEKAVYKVGSVERVSDIIEFYLDKVKAGEVDKKFIYRHPKNFWDTGIEVINNEMHQKKSVATIKKTSKKMYCIECHKESDHENGSTDTLCPICSNGEIFTKRMYEHEKSVRNPQPQKQAPIINDDLENDADYQTVQNFLKGF